MGESMVELLPLEDLEKGKTADSGNSFLKLRVC